MLDIEADYSGLLPTHTITDERMGVTPANINHFNFIIPLYTPFYRRKRDGDPIRLIHEDSGQVLQEGVDYEFTNKHEDLSLYTQTDVYGSINFFNRELSGVVRIEEYQTVGGPWQIADSVIAAQLANRAENPRTVTFEQVFGLPAGVPPLEHGVDIESLKGFEDVVAALMVVKQAIADKVIDLDSVGASVKSEVMGPDPVEGFETITKIGQFVKALPSHDELYEEREITIGRSEDVVYRFSGKSIYDFNVDREAVALLGSGVDVKPVSCAVNGNTVLVGGTMGFYLRSTDRCATWTLGRLAAKHQNSTITAIAFNDLNVVMGTSTGGVVFSLDGGETFIESNDDVGVHVNNLVYVDYGVPMWILMGRSGVVRRSTNSGLSWSSDYAFSARYNPIAYTITDENRLVIAMETGEIFQTGDGLSFYLMDYVLPGFITGITSRGTEVIVGTSDSKVFTTTDNGYSFTESDTNLGHIKYFHSNDHRMLRVGSNHYNDAVQKRYDDRGNLIRSRTIERSLDHGTTWTLATVKVDDPQFKDLHSDGGLVCMVGESTKGESFIVIHDDLG